MFPPTFAPHKDLLIPQTVEVACWAFLMAPGVYKAFEFRTA